MGQPKSPIIPVLGNQSVKEIANISQSAQYLSTTHTRTNQSGLPDETQCTTNIAQLLSIQNPVNLSNSLQACAGLGNGMQLDTDA